MQIPFLNLKTQHEPIKEEIFEKLGELYDRTEFAYGKSGKEFESHFSKYNHTKYACALDNGTNAIELCLRAANIGIEDEVLTVANTFIATIAAINFTGAKPVFVEIDPNTWNLDPDKVEEKITSRTKAILPVHLYGQPADMIELKRIAQKHNLVLIGDSAQSIGSKIFENEIWKSPCEFADLSSFSFYAGKNLGACGEAGAVVTDNQEYANYINAFRDHGSKEKYIHEFVGKNHRIDAFQAAILNIKLKYIDHWNKKRREIASWYLDALKDIDEIQLPSIKSNVQSVFHLFVILVKNRLDFQDFLKNNGIGTAFHYKLPVHLQNAFKFLNLEKGSLPITESIVEKNISLPMFPELKYEEIIYIANTIKKYFTKNISYI